MPKRISIILNAVNVVNVISKFFKSHLLTSWCLIFELLTEERFTRWSERGSDSIC